MSIIPVKYSESILVDDSRNPKIKFFTPSELRNYQPDKDAVLVGDCHIMRGEITIIGGEPSVGKSLSATELAICGATGRDWLGMKVHSKFKTLIIQNENGRYRLQKEYEARGDIEGIEEYILVSEPPPYGLTFSDPIFIADVQDEIEKFKPDLVILDPWNAVAKDDKQKDYLQTFDAIRTVLPKGRDKPALVIIAHTRKPKGDENRNGGSGLMHLLAGSYVLSSIPRSVFIMLRGTSVETDNSITFFNPKNSNGENMERSAWERSPAGFQALPDFDWASFDQGEGGRNIIRFEHIQEVLSDGPCNKSEAVKRLQEVTELGERACQKALSNKGKFAAKLKFMEGNVSLK